MNDGGSNEIVGRSAERQVLITETLVRRFADVVDDHNPLHLDVVAARGSRFGHPIAHGMLIGSLFSGVIAGELPGPGTIYLSQSLRFRRPVAVGDTVTVSVTCLSADSSRGTFATDVRDQAGELCVTGEAVVLLPGA